MKNTILLLIAVIVVLFSLPLFNRPAIPSTEKVEQTPEQTACPIMMQVQGVEEPIPLEAYIKGVIAAEMPVTFQLEALKAQALAARTYALKITEKGTKPIAKDVSAQVYMTEEERQKRWGAEFDVYEEKVTEAVKETLGQVILYEDELISAMFFATSNGKTETAENFSGTAIPYLQSVESVGEEEITRTYKEEKTMDLEEWNQLLGVNWDEKVFQSLQLVRNTSGRVQKLTAVNYENDGRKIREKLGLRSTDFNIAFDVANEQVLIETIGYGHGVGMSQYGAEALARKGKTAEEIISHYYLGTTIKNIENSTDGCLKEP